MNGIRGIGKMTEHSVLEYLKFSEKYIAKYGLPEFTSQTEYFVHKQSSFDRFMSLYKRNEK